MSKTLAIELDEDIRVRLERLAHRTARPPAALIATALRTFLDSAEADASEAAEDHARWDRYQATGQSVPNDDVVRWLDSYTAGAKPPCPRYSGFPKRWMIYPDYWTFWPPQTPTRRGGPPAR